MSASEESTVRIHEQDLELQAALRAPLQERRLSVIFERIYQFNWFVHEDGSPAAVHAEAMHERLECDGDDVREFWRAEATGLAELGPADSQALVGRLLDIGGGGLCVSTTRPLEVGATTEARLTDEDGGWTYEFPCVVVWSEGAPDPRAGLRFEGKPRRSRLD